MIFLLQVFATLKQQLLLVGVGWGLVVGVLDPQNTEMSEISHVIIFASHPDSNFERKVIERSFGHNLQILAGVGYLKRDMLTYADRATMQQIKDCAIKVRQKTETGNI